MELLAGGIEEVFRSEEVNDLCYQKAVEYLPKAEAFIEGHRHGKTRPGVQNAKAKSKRLTHTCIGLVVPNNKIAAKIAYKYGMRLNDE